MKELSLNILDIAMNSVSAEASLIEIIIDENIKSNKLTIVVSDNGCGMSKEFLEKVRDPFITTRKTRDIGMGIPLFEQAAVGAGGSLEITSEEGVGTCLTATFEYNNIDRAPIGDMTGTVIALISGNSEMDVRYTHVVDNKEFVFDTAEVKSILGADVSLNETEVLSWIIDYIREGILQIRE